MPSTETLMNGFHGEGCSCAACAEGCGEEGHGHDHGGGKPRAFVVNNDNFSPDNVFTSNSMDVGDTFTGSRNFSGDVDWIAIDLEAGQNVRISMDGLSLPDPLLRLYNASGTEIRSNDDGGGGLNAEIEFEAGTTGTYFIATDSYNFTDTGTYRVSVTEFAPAPAAPFDPLRSIDWGTRLFGDTVDVHFAGFGVREDGVTSEGWNSYETAQFQAAFDLIESVTNLTFNVTSNRFAADFVLINDTNEIDDLGYFNPPATSNAGVGVFGSDDWDRFSGGDLEKGGFGFVTIVHELLHGLGLAHPHDTGGFSTIMEGVSDAFDDYGAYDLNQGVYTVMTYNSGFQAGPVGTRPNAPSNNWGFEAGPMALDIAVLQDKYGANATTGAGDTVYTLASANGLGTYWQAIWDTSGTDEFRYVGSADTTIDLRAATLEDEDGGGGWVSAAAGIAGGFTIANGVVIENATGASGDDVITGNTADNVLSGRAGNDTLVGGRGDDRIETGTGNDDAKGDGGNDTLIGGDGNDTLRGGRESDLIQGGNQNDVIRGQSNADTVEGGAGDDNVKGGGGNDIVRGGGGNDFLTGGTRRDTIEGGDGNDQLIGNSFDDSLAGGAGNDTLKAGGDNDTLNGGAGNDFLKGGGGADMFVFQLGMGSDRVTDLNLAEDMFEIGSGLAAGRDADAIEALARSIGTGTEIDFGNGDVIFVTNLMDVEGLADIISIV